MGSRRWLALATSTLLATATAQNSVPAPQTTKCYNNGTYAPVPTTLAGYSNAQMMANETVEDLTADPCVSSVCYSSLLDNWSEWNYGGKASTIYSTGTYPNVNARGVYTTTMTWENTGPSPSAYPFNRNSPCCGKCIAGPFINPNISYFPTPAITGAATVITNSNGVVLYVTELIISDLSFV